MFREMRAIEYSLEIINVLENGVEIECKEIISRMNANKKLTEVSASYIPKVLAKLAKSKIIKSSERGYTLLHAPQDIMISDIIDILDLPMSFELLHKLCYKIKEQCSRIALTEIYDFEK